MIPIIPPLTDEEKKTILEDGDGGEFRVIVIPANPWADVHEKLLSHTDKSRRLQQLTKLVGGYIVDVRAPALETMSRDLGLLRSQQLSLLACEDGTLMGYRHNSRADVFHVGNLVGDVLLLASGPVEGSSYDLISLPDHVTIYAITKWVLSHADRG